jgi:site-specific DNA-methyltransferase (adenine-specific)
MPDCSVDAVVTDPPYGLSFMGKRWDYDVPSTEIWAECLRVIKPGGYLLAFAGTRTQHRMAVRIEDAGFEIRDMLAWMYGSGFPKSHNLDGEYQGWGTALKPAMEPITMARKPFKATVAQNVQEWGTGAINIDGCRIETADSWNRIRGSVVGLDGGFLKHKKEIPRHSNTLGRFPANVLHDGSKDILEGMGEAARFFYTPKACKDDRDDGCEMMEARGRTFAFQRCSICGKQKVNVPGSACQCIDPKWVDAFEYSPRQNFHPTVKPTDLMRYLCRMVTPTGGIVLDPFTGSGSTGRGAVLEGFRFIGCEMDADYITIAKARILAAEKAYQPCLIFD